jgi:hypothetical protein
VVVGLLNKLAGVDDGQFDLKYSFSTKFVTNIQRRTERIIRFN